MTGSGFSFESKVDRRGDSSEPWVVVKRGLFYLDTLSYGVAQDVLKKIAAATNAKVQHAHELTGGWTDQSDNVFYPESTLITELGRIGRVGGRARLPPAEPPSDRGRASIRLDADTI